jgi:hypothetical protein
MIGCVKDIVSQLNPSRTPEWDQLEKTNHINKAQAELLSQRKMGCASGMMSGVPLFGFLYYLTPDFQRWDLELPLGYSCVTAFPTVFRQPLVSPQNRHHDMKPIYANSGTYLQRYPASGLCTSYYEIFHVAHGSG